MYKCVCIWFLVAETEFGYPTRTAQLTSLCCHPFKKKYFDALLKRLGNRQARDLALKWIGTATRSGTTKDKLLLTRSLSQDQDAE